jgi:FixJ family two-component response regulator
VAVCEPNADVREALTLVLCANGWAVVAPGGFSGLSSLVNSGSLDAVISDCGFRMIPSREVLDVCSDRRVPVIFIGRNIPVQFAVDLMHRGAIDFLDKPFPESRLLETLDGLSEGQDPCRRVASGRHNFWRTLEVSKNESTQ